jgi:hypothetical protein
MNDYDHLDMLMLHGEARDHATKQTKAIEQRGHKVDNARQAKALLPCEVLAELHALSAPAKAYIEMLESMNNTWCLNCQVPKILDPDSKLAHDISTLRKHVDSEFNEFKCRVDVINKSLGRLSKLVDVSSQQNT